MTQLSKACGHLRVLHCIFCILLFWILFISVNLATLNFNRAKLNDVYPPRIAFQQNASLADPFFTLTPRRSRLCSVPPQLHGMKVILLQHQNTHVNMSTENVIITNLKLSLRRFNFENPDILLSASYHSENSIAAIEYQLRELSLATTDLILICNTVHLVVATSQSDLLAKFRALHKKLVISTIVATEQDVFCALGEYSILMLFFQDWNDRIGSDTTKYVMKFLREPTKFGHIDPHIHVDADFRFFGYIPNSEVTRKELWAIQTPSPDEPRRLIYPRNFRVPIIVNTPKKLRHQMPPRVIYKPAQYSPSILLFSNLTSSSSTASSESMYAASLAKTRAIYDYLGYASAVESSFSDPFYVNPIQSKSLKRNFRVVASLTSLPDRLPRIERTLHSLLNQHVPADAIYLNIPKHYVRFGNTENGSDITTLVPDKVRELPVIINIVEKDWGPATKLIPTLQLELNPSTIIITVDDDMVFKPTLFGLLLYNHLNNPHFAFGNAGQLVDVDGKFGPAVVRTAWQWKDNSYPVDILEAFRGAVYKRSFFDNMPELLAITPECFFTDDIWISAYLSRRHIPRIKLVEGWGDVAEFAENDQVTPLRSENLNGSRRNDVCALSLLHDFKLGWSEGTDEKCSFEFTKLATM